MSGTPYILGHDPEEIRRLELQAMALEPLTTRLLRAAGLADGMSVLDIGTGAGGREGDAQPALRPAQRRRLDTRHALGAAGASFLWRPARVRGVSRRHGAARGDATRG